MKFIIKFHFGGILRPLVFDLMYWPLRPLRPKFYEIRTSIFWAQKSPIYISITPQKAGVDRRTLFYFPPPYCNVSDVLKELLLQEWPFNTRSVCRISVRLFWPGNGGNSRRTVRNEFLFLLGIVSAWFPPYLFRHIIKEKRSFSRFWIAYLCHFKFSVCTELDESLWSSWAVFFYSSAERCPWIAVFFGGGLKFSKQLISVFFGK